ncbi:chemotaxis protein CheW [Pseudoalteromonas sp. MMG024]|uniref:chemotaxis protein CheW n=1 Tax=Pseudoalteromonas sp. MMG024 TaxID=2909980 RepID=UPI001F2F306A|nr:chemotaxis protein CheW [Pseudoalteromonas sp. MMG024]MCF6458924.1 chemotaxis protein CheW [Pseudoalteromonas sp. MMG024]
MKELNCTWIFFYIGKSAFIHPVESVKEVIEFKPPQPVPGSEQSHLGIISVRGEIISIFNGYSFAEKSSDKQIQANHIMLVETKEAKIGITINAVHGVINLNPDDIELLDSNSPYLIGTYKIDNTLMTAVNFAVYQEGKC